MQEEPGRSMDLSENWSLEEGSWLSHTGAQHFPSTRGGMATLHGPDSLGISHSCPSLCQPVCTPRLPRLVGYSRAAGWSLLSWDLEVRQTYVQIPKAFIVTYVTIRNTIALGETRSKNSCSIRMGTNSDNDRLSFPELSLCVRNWDLTLMESSESPTVPEAEDRVAKASSVG